MDSYSARKGGKEERETDGEKKHVTEGTIQEGREEGGGCRTGKS